MSILHPGFLWLLIPLGILFFYREKKLTETVHLIILFLIVLALSRPVFIQGVEESLIEAQEYVIALDVSYSMRAKDLKPDRYIFAKGTIDSLLKKNEADNIMLIAFTSNPLLLSPPTTDHRMIEVALKSLNPEYILTKGTSLKKLFKKVASMPESEKNLLLMTDGGEESDLEGLAEQVRRSGIKLTILALGTKEGMTVENPDGSLLKDKEGHLVISRINPILETLASETDGTYLTAASTPEATADRVYKALKAQTESTEMITKKQHRYTELYQVPLFLAVVLFMMLHTRAVRFLVIALALLGIHAEASMLDGYRLNKAYSSYRAGDFNASKAYLKNVETPSLQSRFALGNIYYREGAYDKALKAYASIRSTSVQVKQKLYYNTANCYARKQAYEKAKIYYTKALQLGDDKDAKENLKLVALLADKKSAGLGIAHPKSQNSGASKSGEQEESSKKSRDEDQPSSGSGSGGENSKSKKEQAKRKLLLDSKAEQQPLSSKVYELINKGYIHETHPW
ncbi:vWA domain-containing protein [Sulfurovum sp. NBC37-1]|uniref:vWA domain-containing protein n=1 Tax=Sulfurovum sp. (strain NBC37-1) TaxID=387093 RepID=UPI0001587AC8|nr:VWA domain-containing protein [Sulfurovum sp. NBC37-1]BAF73342.1 von Willebrand factor type A domain protein [Sulfurovum sp. NBC37-1]